MSKKCLKNTPLHPTLHYPATSVVARHRTKPCHTIPQNLRQWVLGSSPRGRTMKKPHSPLIKRASGAFLILRLIREIGEVSKKCLKKIYSPVGVNTYRPALLRVDKHANGCMGIGV